MVRCRINISRFAEIEWPYVPMRSCARSRPQLALKELRMADKILIVEDDDDIVEILSLYLSSSGYDVDSASNGTEGIERLRTSGASAILVDLMMPSMNGFDFIKQARTFCDAPIIIVSARNQPTDKMLGLDLGADGYITKPFDPVEVLAYVRAVLRRYHQGGSGGICSVQNDDGQSVIQAGRLSLDLNTLVLRKDGVVINLTASELKIIAKFLQSPRHIFTKAQLYEVVSGSTYGDGAESIMVHISNIRSKIEDDPNKPQFIVTVRGLGYRYEG